MSASTARRPLRPRLPVEGEVLGGRFEVLGMLGEGGMGHVYRAHDRRRGREVALKLLTPRYLGRPEREERFLRELELGTRAEHHRNLVEILEGGRLDHHGWPFLVMEPVAGRDLASRLVHGPLEPPLATRLARQVAGAVRALHRAGVVHRDVTSMNILVHEEDAVLIDLSHAAEVAAPQLGRGHRRLTRDHEVPGTHHAMAPEQARAEPAHPAMDVYAFGVMLVHMLTGVAPGTCGREAFIELQREGKLRPPRIDTPVYPEVPLVLAELADACTGADPGRRPTMDEVVGRLDALLVVMPVAAADPSGPVPAANERVSAEDVCARAASAEGSTSAAVAGAPQVVTGGAGSAEPEGAPQVAAVSTGPDDAATRRSWGRRVAVVATGVGVLAGSLWLWRAEPDQGTDVERVAETQRSAPWSPDAAPGPDADDGSGGAKTPTTEARAFSPASPQEADEAPQPSPSEEPTQVAAQPDDGEPAHGSDTRASRRGSEETDPTPMPEPEHAKSCSGVVDQAIEARRSRHWSRVDQLTRSTRCWDDAPTRARLRVKALSELGRYRECAAVGQAVEDPEVNRLAAHCAIRLETEVP